MAGNSTTITFAGDADDLRKAAKESTDALDEVGAAAGQANEDMGKTSKGGDDLSSKMGHLGSTVSGTVDAIGTLADGMQALADVQNIEATRAARQARLTADVEQAQIDQRQAAEDLRQANLDLSQSYLDGEQALVDGKQAAIDIKQATLDAEVAQTEYNAAVKEHGKNSAEAKQASIDLDQATADLSQAQLDQKQAQQDANQYTADGRQAMIDATQATRDGKDATLDLNDALKEANPSGLQKWADNLALVTPLLSAVVGVMGLVTAAQWLWNASLWASPVTWIVIGVIALIAVIVLIATKTTWFQDIWNAAWGGIKSAASWAWDGIKSAASATWEYLQKVWDYVLATPGKIKSAFSSAGSFISAPFRAGFNAISDAWNNTIGRLSWSVPDWVPYIGGNTISVPKLPHYHQGGIVPGGLGAETLAVLQSGERITAGAGGDGGYREVRLVSDGTAMSDWVLEMVRDAVGLRGGDPVRVLGNTRG
jgi:hypothetical protein